MPGQKGKGMTKKTDKNRLAGIGTRLHVRLTNAADSHRNAPIRQRNERYGTRISNGKVRKSRDTSELETEMGS